MRRFRAQAVGAARAGRRAAALAAAAALTCPAPLSRCPGEHRLQRGIGGGHFCLPAIGAPSATSELMPFMGRHGNVLLRWVLPGPRALAGLPAPRL